MLRPFTSVHKPVVLEEAAGAMQCLSALQPGSSPFNTGPHPKPDITSAAKINMLLATGANVPHVVPVPDDVGDV